MTDIQKLQEFVQGTIQQFRHQPNDAAIRAQIKSIVDGYLQTLQDRREFYDFQVVCSEANNPSSIVDRGEVIVDISIKPHCWFAPAGLDRGLVNNIHAHLHEGVQFDIPTEQETIEDMYIKPAGRGSKVQTLPEAKEDESNMKIAPMIEMILNEDGNPDVAFNGVENGKIISAHFQPESNITTHEYMLIQQAQLMMVSVGLAGATLDGMFNPIVYIRKHNLERHFKFSEL